MTFRAKPVVKRAHRPAWETQDRRNFYLNLGFGLIVVLAVLILAIAAAAVLVQRPPRAGRQRRRPVDHQGRVPRPLPDRDLAARRGGAPDPDRGPCRAPDRSPGHVAPVRASPSSASQLPSTTLERLIDTKLQAKLAAAGRRHRDARGHRRPARRARRRRPESRHAWVIEVAPETDLGAVGPTAAQKAAAKAKAEAALKDLQSGKSLGRRRQDRLDRCVDRAAGRRPRLAAGRRHADRTRPTSRPSSPPRSNTPTAVVEGERRHLPDRPRDRDRAGDGRPRLPGQARERRHRPRQVPRVVAGDVIHEKLEDKIVARRHRRRPAAARLGDLPRRGRARPRRGRGQGPPHPVLARRTTRRTRRTSPTAIPRGRRPRSQATRDLRPAQGRSRPVRRDRPRGERRGAGPGAERERRQAAVLRQRKLRRRGVHGRDPGARASRTARSCQPVKSAFGWHVIQVMYHPTDADQLDGAQDGRPTAGSDFGDPRPRQLRGADVGRRRRPRLDRQGPARRRADRRDLRHPDRQDLRGRRPSPATGRTCSRSSARRPGRRRAGSSRS